jgi:cell division protein FtsW
LLAPRIGILLLQPDVGQTALLTTLVRGHAVLRRLALLLARCAGRGRRASRDGAYFLHPHVRERIAQFLDAGGYQTGLALKAFEAGGITGVGPGAGT